MIFTSEDTNEPIRFTLEELGIVVDEEKSIVQDEQNKSADGTLITIPSTYTHKYIRGLSKPIAYSGVAHTTLPSTRIFHTMLTGTSTSSSISTSSKKILNKDNLVSLCTYTQTQNNARVSFCGSIELIHDRVMYDEQTYSNTQFIESLSLLTFKSKGILSISDIQHTLASVPSSTYILDDRKNVYRVGDQINITFSMYEYVGYEQKQQPYIADDVQLEVIMLDPHIRTTVPHIGNGKYMISIRLPETFGVYKLTIEYKRMGYTYIHTQETILIRPYAHNEYERFIDVAYPYYTCAWLNMAAFFVFSVVFMYTKEKK